VAVKRARWLGDDAKQRFTTAVKAIEGASSAEVVVTVRDQSASYRHVELALGTLAALVALAGYLYAPLAFDDDLALPAVVLAFVAGVILGTTLETPKRLMVTRAERQRLVDAAARAAFVEQGISRTRDRTGILVFVSLLENAVSVVPDIGVDEKAMGAAWTEARARLDACAAAAATPEAMAEALLAFAEPLGRVLPVREDDTNELPDEVGA
jgi:putative membrane protein